jgi:hypothetical protein
MSFVAGYLFDRAPRRPEHGDVVGMLTAGAIRVEHRARLADEGSAE